ncbi:hypothetical protein B0H16DRAFT_1479514 [Mycena metata]|uniref:Uncharacterized protein n=1 Tax=Mycena metata TaxID=1033252 RepID=A0AAD7MDV9_9AGAR|nr:hypothetical protein B0H16DRAFT_1479514 [Mycena metata]
MVTGRWGGESPNLTDWGSLDASGINGYISIAVSLYFWGTLQSHDEGTRAEWERAVEDVTWMLEGLSATRRAERHGYWGGKKQEVGRTPGCATELERAPRAAGANGRINAKLMRPDSAALGRRQAGGE